MTKEEVNTIVKKAKDAYKEWEKYFDKGLILFMMLLKN